MLLSTQYNIKMPKRYKKILYLYAAYNETFFFLGQKQIRQDCVTHVDLKGRILFQFTFDKAVQSCGMLSDREGIVIQSKNNSITIFDLQTYKVQRYPHQYMDEQADRSKIHTFSDKKLLCIEQKGKYGHDKLKLSYYYYPFLKGKNKPCAVYQSKQGQFNHQYQVFKANNSSMICWWRPLIADHIRFFYFDLRQKDKGSLKECNISVESIYHKIGYPNFSNKMQIALTHIWEFRKGIFLLICMVYTGSSDKKQPYTRYLLYNTYMFSIKEARFSFGILQDYVINCYNLGRASVFMTYEVEEAEIEQSAIYYVDHETQAIITQQTWECNNNTYYQLPGYQTGLICEGIYALQDVQKFTLFKKRLLTAKQMYAHIILSTYPFIDQNFLIQILKSLYYSNIQF